MVVDVTCVPIVGATVAIAELAFHHPEHVLDLGADFPEPTVASALRDRQWAPGLRFRLYGPQNIEK